MAAGVASVVMAGRGVAGGRTGVLAGVVTGTGVDAGGASGVVASTAVGVSEVAMFELLSSGAAAVSVTIEPLVQIAARFSLLISNSITFRRGFIGAVGSVMFLPLIVS